MAGSTQMGIDVSKFKQGINEAKASLKTLDAALKLNETQLKATGDKEVYLANKTATLKAQIEAQGNIVRTTTAALQAMDKAGVNPLSTDYQKLQAQLYQANEAMIESTSSLSQLEAGAEEASESTDKLSDSVGSIGKKLSLDAVIGGIDKITGTMEKAAKMAVNLGKAIWDNITDSASWADNVATQATILGVSVEEYQQLQGVFDTIADVTVNDWMNAKRKVQAAINNPSNSQIDVLAALGISTHNQVDTGFGQAEGLAKNWEDVFWEAAQRLKKMVENNPNSADLADTYGEALFGKKFSNLKPLIDLGREAFTEALDKQITVSEEAIDKLEELNDAYIDLKNDWEKLEAQVLSGLAPALTQAAGVLDSLLENLMKYLQSEDGQRLLENMGEVVSNMFADLSNIDPEDVVNKFTGVFNKVTESLQWIADHWEDVVNGLKGIAGAWGALKLTGGALQLLALVNGLRNLRDKGVPSLPGTEQGGGGFWNGLMDKASIFAAETLPKLTGATMTNMGFIFDWFMHNTAPGQALTNGGSLQDAFNAAVQGVTGWWGDTKTRAGTFMQDWLGLFEQITGGYGAAHSATNSRLFDPNAFQAEVDALLGGTKVTVDTVPEEGSAEKISNEVGVVEIPATLVPWGGRWISPSFTGGAGGGGGGRFGDIEFHANGLPMVPWDGYPAILHKGERVVPARAMSNTRNYNSNLYIENMTMNNGQDADGLAAKVAAAQRWENRGFGS